jgi:hypothetical protein
VAAQMPSRPLRTRRRRGSAVHGEPRRRRATARRSRAGRRRLEDALARPAGRRGDRPPSKRAACRATSSSRHGSHAEGFVLPRSSASSASARRPQSGRGRP